MDNNAVAITDLKSYKILGSEYDPWNALSSAATDITYKRSTDYGERCRTVINDYDADPMFAFLIDRLSHFGINGTTWQLEKTEERPFWSEWGRSVNTGMVDVIPGLDQVEMWMMKALAQTGMAAIQWQWGTLRVGKRDFTVPKYITMHPSANVTLKNDSGRFGSNLAFYKSNNNKEVALVNTKANGAFVLKLNSGPGDMTSSGYSAGNNRSNVVSTRYPNPPFLGAHEDIETRLKLREVDRDAVMRLLRLMWIVSIGDKEHNPVPQVINPDGTVAQKGTIEEIKDNLADPNGLRNPNIRTLYFPYWMKMEPLTVDTSVLLNSDKYLSSTLNLLWTFGIFVVPGKDARLNFTDINTQNMEQLIDFMRIRHIGRFIEGVLCQQIVERNMGKLTEAPSLRWRQLNTKTEAFRQQLLSLAQMGRVSNRITSEHFGMNKDDVVADLRDENKKVDGKSEIDLFNDSVPVQYKQQATDASGNAIESDRLATNKGGRPTGKDPTNKDDE